MDILRPHSPNGIAIALMVSGGWRSKKAGETPVFLVAPLIRAGYTVFAICHISQPDSTVMEMIGDMNRGVRFVRHHAKEYRIDPKRIGVTGVGLRNILASHTEIVVESGATLTRILIQDSAVPRGEASNAIVLNEVTVKLGAGSTYRQFILGEGAKLVRLETTIAVRLFGG